MEAQEAAQVGGTFIVLRIVWAGLPPEACYGPWVIKEDGSHLGEVHAFVRAWADKHGEPSSVTIYSVFAPGEIDGLHAPSDL